jgi:hypothetical protein
MHSIALNWILGAIPITEIYFKFWKSILEMKLTALGPTGPFRIQSISLFVSYMMTHQASNLTLGIVTTCSKLKCEQMNQTQMNICVWTHFHYVTENGYLSLQNLIKVPAGGGSKLFWHIKHTLM